MKTCEFCGRESKRKFCSQICSDAHESAQVTGTELGKNQLGDFAPLQPHRDDNYGYRRVRHMHQ